MMPSGVFACVDVPLFYSHRAVFTGDKVHLGCNSAADVMWTFDAGTDDDGYVQYVYWGGHFTSLASGRLLVYTTSGSGDSGSQILVISSVQLNDSGLYDCYDSSGLRLAGYRLTVNGKC